MKKLKRKSSEEEKEEKSVEAHIEQVLRIVY